MRLNLNQLSGSIPKEINNLTNLQILNLDRNQLNQFIPSLDLPKLQTLSLAYNKFYGPIPNLQNLPSLENYYINDLLLTGSVPTNFKFLHSLQNLYIENNELSGTIPDIWENITEFKRFYLNNNHFTGTLPKSLRYIFFFYSNDLLKFNQK